jgi:hypothetical protein
MLSVPVALRTLHLSLYACVSSLTLQIDECLTKKMLEQEALENMKKSSVLPAARVVSPLDWELAARLQRPHSHL